MHPGIEGADGEGVRDCSGSARAHLDGRGRGDDKEFGSLLGGRPLDARKQRLQDGVAEAGADARVVEQALEVVEDHYGELRAWRGRARAVTNWMCSSGGGVCEEWMCGG